MTNIIIFLAIIIPVFLSGLTFIFLLKNYSLGIFNYPLDLNFKFLNRRIFGENKKIRGPVLMSFFTAIYGFIFFKVFYDLLNSSLNDRTVFIYYFIVGLAYSLGELPNSFIKRQLNIEPGRQSHISLIRYIFRFIDIFDSLIFVGLVYVYLFKFPIKIVLASVFLGGLIHYFTDILMQKIGLKKKNQ